MKSLINDAYDKWTTGTVILNPSMPIRLSRLPAASHSLRSLSRQVSMT